MKRRLQTNCTGHLLTMLLACGALWPAAGCGPSYQDHWNHAQVALANGRYGPARIFLEECNLRRPRRVEVLHDLGVCSLILAKEKFQQLNRPAALRELDAAIGYFSNALDENPGHTASLQGLNAAHEMKGQYDEALDKVEWAAKYVGPSAKQYLILAAELEERGDQDGALLRYRQAVAMEPDNATAHAEFAKFLLRVPNEAAAVQHMLAAYQADPNDEWVISELAARNALPQPNRPAGVP
jgi:tetratricopeptide (TPR) repeat protein